MVGTFSKGRGELPWLKFLCGEGSTNRAMEVLFEVCFSGLDTREVAVEVGEGHEGHRARVPREEFRS